MCETGLTQWLVAAVGTLQKAAGSEKGKLISVLNEENEKHLEYNQSEVLAPNSLKTSIFS